MYIKSLLICVIFSLNLVQGNRDALVGGRDPLPGETKYIVAFRSYKSICGGGIIGEKFILTAAHCIKIDPETGKLRKPMRITGGTNVFSGYNKAHVVQRDVYKAYLVAPYEKGGHDDIAILELEKPLNLLKYHKKLRMLNLPKPLPDDPSKYPTYENQFVTFAGFGHTRAELVDDDGYMEIKRSGAGRLQVADAVINDAKTCQKYFKDAQDSEMCLSVIEDKNKTNPQGTCQGDSGSPAVYNHSIVIGLDSRGYYCDNNRAPTLFTRVSSYIPFINQVMEGNIDGLIVYEA